MSYIIRAKQTALIALASVAFGTTAFAQASRTKPNNAVPAEAAKPSQAGDKKAPESKPAETAKPPTPVEAKMDRTLMKTVQGNAEWKRALEILSDDGDVINLAEAKVLRLADQGKAVEVTVKISASVKGRIPDFGQIVYQSDPKGAAIVFFTDLQKTPKDNPKGENAKAIKLCGPWGPWQRSASYCDPNFWCFGKGQKARYHNSTRTRQCSFGVLSHTCRVKEECGC